MKTLMIRFIREDEGQNLVEYALLAGLVAVVAITAMTSVGTNVNRIYNAIVTKLTGVTP
jgi:pilus assembly protein Flp/PilA